MVKHTETIRRQFAENCLSLFDHFLGLALKELMQDLRENSSKILKFLTSY